MSNFLSDFHPHIFQKNIPNEKGGNLTEEKRNEELKKEAARKWWVETVNNIFPSDWNQLKTKELLETKKQELKNAKVDISTNPYKIILDEIVMFQKGIFDNKWNYRSDAKEWISKLKIAIWIDWKNTIEEVNEISSKTQEFIKKYPLSDFKNLIFKQCIEHPFISNTWVFFNEYKDIKREVESLGKNLPPEYAAIIGTMDNVRVSKKFGDLTGKIDEGIQKKLWNEKIVIDFKQNMRTFLDISITQKKALTMSDFDKQFDEKRTLDMNESRTVWGYLANIEKDISKIEGHEKKIDRINEFINITNKNDNKLPKNVVSDITTFLVSKKQRIIQLSELDNKIIGLNTVKKFNWQKNTSENLQKATTDAEEREKKTWIPQFVYFQWNPSTWAYIVISSKEISDIIKTDINKLNWWLFKSLIELNWWESVFQWKYMSEEAFAAVWAYIEWNPDSLLFKEFPNWKKYFIEKYSAMVWKQTKILDKLTDLKIGWDFLSMFPKFNAKFGTECSDEMRGKLTKWDVRGFYDELVKKWKTTGEALNYLDVIINDFKELEIQTKRDVIRDSWVFKWKKLNDYKDLFKFSDKNSLWLFESIQNIDLWTIAFDEKKLNLLLWSIQDKKHPLYQYLENQVKSIKVSSSIGSATDTSINLKWELKNSKLRSLTQDQVEKNKKAEKFAIAQNINSTTNLLTSKNSDFSDLEKFNNIELIDIEINRLMKNLTSKNKEKIELLSRKRHNLIAVAQATTNYIKSPGNIESNSIKFIREMSGWQSSDLEIKKWMDTQQFISTYVAEKDFVDMVEKNAAYMNLEQSKSVSELYGIGKVDISSMSSENGSIRLAETNIWWFDSFQWVNELMNCKVQIWDNWIFTRTLRSPNGMIIAENIPLENINSTLQQLWRFYALGLWSLAPYMEQIATSIWKSRSDKITGLDGSFNINEDTKFLKILTVMIYGEDSLPAESNIPNLIRLFNRTWHENDPKYILLQKGILQDTGWINIIKLDSNLQDSSKKVI